MRNFFAVLGVVLLALGVPIFIMWGLSTQTPREHRQWRAIIRTNEKTEAVDVMAASIRLVPGGMGACVEFYDSEGQMKAAVCDIVAVGVPREK